MVQFNIDKSYLGDEVGMQFPAYTNDNQHDANQVPSDENFEYYQEYMRLYIANVVLTNQLKELLNEKNDLLQRLGRLEKKNQELTKSVEETGEERKKRLRRSAQEIERHFKCPVENCQKQYGQKAEGSLNQHLKLKHPELVRERVSGEDEDNEPHDMLEGDDSL